MDNAALTLTGYSWEELFGINSAALMPRPAQAAKRVAAVGAGSLRAGTGSIRRKDGTVLDVDFDVGLTTLLWGEQRYLSLCWPSA